MTGRRMRRMTWPIAVALALLLQAPVAAEEPPRWQFEVEPYLWLFGTFGTYEVLGRSASVDNTIGDTLTLLFDGDAFAGGGYFSVSHDRWSFFVDAFGGYAEESAT